MSEISVQLFSTLEASFQVKMDGERACTRNYASIHEQQKVFQEKVNNIITSLESSESLTTEGQERTPLCTCEHKVVVWPQISRYQSSIMVLFCVLFFGYLVSFFQILLPFNVT